MRALKHGKRPHNHYDNCNDPSCTCPPRSSADLMTFPHWVQRNWVAHRAVRECSRCSWCRRNGGGKLFVKMAQLASLTQPLISQCCSKAFRVYRPLYWDQIQAQETNFTVLESKLWSQPIKKIKEANIVSSARRSLLAPLKTDSPLHPLFQFSIIPCHTSN